LTSENSLSLAAVGLDALFSDGVVDLFSTASDSHTNTDLVESETALASSGLANTIDSLLTNSAA
jgi:hypothetical protein